MERKASLSAELVQGAEKFPLLAVYFEFNHLKQLYRQGWLKRGLPREQCESVADHILGVALLAWFFTEKGFPSDSREKILHMALIHDMGEVYVGDITPADDISPGEKRRLERGAVRRIFERLPGGREYLELWEEYEAGITQEARLVRQLDRLEMALQALVYERQGLGNLDEFFRSATTAIHSHELGLLLDEVKKLR
jgi:putative hydrolase of HD superfamily